MACWRGELTSRRGAHYTVENARLYTLPNTPPEIMVAASGPEAAELAGEIGDGLVSTAPDRALVDAFERTGGTRKPRFAQVTVCWAQHEDEAIATALRIWPNAALRGTLGQELPLPSHFQQAAEMVGRKEIAEVIVCGPDSRPASRRRSASTSTQASTTSISIRSAPTRTVSCTSTSARSFRRSAERPRLDGHLAGGTGGPSQRAFGTTRRGASSVTAARWELGLRV